MENQKELNYLFVLKALEEIPFNIGRRLLKDFLNGDKNNQSVSKNKLYEMKNFGTLRYEQSDLNSIIDNLISNGMIEIVSMPDNKFLKLLKLSIKGKNEINNPSLYKRKLSFNSNNVETKITDKEKNLFIEFKDFLSKFNQEQKKAIINDSKKILCIAGAGSGKTTTLTKRIEFLIKHRKVDSKKILAITFTRKARQEMMLRLSNLGQTEVMVETFNSFCEKILRKYNNLIYEKEVRVITYADKIKIIQKALDKLKMNFSNAIEVYFTPNQRRGKTEEQLTHIFLNDCFFIRDYFKFKNVSITESFSKITSQEHKKSAEMMLGVSNFIEAYMRRYGLRDFADQLIDAINFFEKNQKLIPEFDHVLIDEYQDINSTQIKLIDLLSPENLFCVGDPRQSIYGWRGSDINYILQFNKKYPDSEIIALTKNYRSTKHIVDLINLSIKNMQLVDLESDLDEEGKIKLEKFSSEDEEFSFVIRKISSSKLPRNEIFVLARTNNQLNELSKIMKQKEIKHIVKSDDLNRSVQASKEEITLSTIHAIKGLEAETVFVIGCTGNNFPCKASEHPIVEMVKIQEYDKEEEEQRLFYVAMSRAKKDLYLTYSSKKPTYFINDKMIKMINLDKQEPLPLIKEILQNNKINSLTKDLPVNKEIIEKLKSWRKTISKEQNIPSFTVIHNKTLVAIAQKMPKSSSQLKKIEGIGPAKIEKYGPDILKIVNN